MSTPSRWIGALAALSIAVPAAASAAATSTDQRVGASGGATYGAAALRAQRRAAHLGDRVPVRRGMRGHDVKVLQDFFNRIGMHVRTDGSFGTGTWRALRRFEKRAGRPVDGVLDSGDLSSLRSVIARGGFKLRQQAPTPAPLPAGSRARVNDDGTATAPAGAPAAVQAIIAAGNVIATKPYRYGGGHGSFKDSGYDCSGSVSYALHGADLLGAPRDSTGLESFGEDGAGSWVTVYANSGHTYMVVAGLRFDTSGRSQNGTRWQSATRPTSGYVVRHPAGL